MKNQSLFCCVARFGVMFGAVSSLILTGCATTPKPTLTPKQCQTVSWQQLGYQDGLLGRSADFFDKHRQACRTTADPQHQNVTADLTANLTAWQQGREQGLAQYCTPLRAYQLGREGFAFNNVCPPEKTLDLLKAHDEGYSFYQREQTLQQLWYDDWYPFGWGRPYWGRPHFYPRYPSRFSHFATPTLPPYVDLEKSMTQQTQQAKQTSEQNVNPTNHISDSNHVTNNDKKTD
ncbi:DUF2799 domain-containing protein [Moraxella boevrei]|uniref:DUF2799 domain-containing protein n=1 Tax=Faucicola boevrei TaxID=346665 RepID=UPI003735C4A5